jgi:hypothetical protein
MPGCASTSCGTSAERIFQIIADDPWDQWNERPIDVFHLAKP